MIDREQIGIRIAALRKKSGLSQQALAEKLGVSAQAVSKWESGKNLPDIDLFRELAWIFDMTIDSIGRGIWHLRRKAGAKAFRQMWRHWLPRLKGESCCRALRRTVLTRNSTILQRLWGK